MTLRSLDTSLRKRAEALSDFTLLVQLRLSESEYEEAFPHFCQVLADASRLNQAPRTFPLSFARMLTELASRSFVPRLSGSPQGSGLWQNLRVEVPYAASDHLIGQAFEQAVLHLRWRYHDLFFRKTTGWRYVSNILIHSGIPVQIVPHLIQALRAYIPEGNQWAKRIDASRIERALHGQHGLNKYTVSVLTQTTEGVRLVQQLLSVCYFVRNGNTPQTAVFSEPFITAVQEALQGEVRRQDVVAVKDRQPVFIFDDMEQFIGWILPAPVSETSSFVVLRSNEPETVAPVELDSGRMGIRVRPERTSLTIRRGSRSGTVSHVRFIPHGVMVFGGANGTMLDPARGLPEEIAPGEHLVLAARMKGVDIEERFCPIGLVHITEEGITLPTGWARSFQGFRIHFPPAANLRVLVSDDRWLSLRVGRAPSRAEGHIMFSGNGSAYLYAYHAAVPERRIPVFAGTDPPAVHFWGDEFSQSVPEVTLSRWTGRDWRIIRNAVADVSFFSDGATLAFRGSGMTDLAEKMKVEAHLLRLDFYDLSYDPRDVDAIYVIWVPGGIFFSQYGLAPSGTGARLSIQLEGDWTAEAPVGTVDVRNVDRRTRVFHRLPHGMRRALVRLRRTDAADSDFTLSWSSPGVAAGALVPRERRAPDESEMPKVALPLPPISLEDLSRMDRVELEWWPGLSVALSLSPQRGGELGEVTFDRHGRSSLHLLPFERVLRDAPAVADGPGLLLYHSNRKWPLFRVVRRGSDNVSEDKSVPYEKLLRLLWEAELFISGNARLGFTKLEDELLEQLKALRTGSLQARFMFDRLEQRWGDLRRQPHARELYSWCVSGTIHQQRGVERKDSRPEISWRSGM